MTTGSRRAYLISKPPRSPRLFWHQDLTVWSGEPRAYSDLTPQLFLMFYLCDTTRNNGCLRVLPGSHRRRHPLHELTGVAHNAGARAALNLDSPIFRAYAGEVDVLVKAGDLVIGDSRILHASHDNDSDQERTVITLFYHPAFKGLTEPAQKQYTDLAETQIGDWPSQFKKKLAPHIANYSGPGGGLEKRPGTRPSIEVIGSRWGQVPVPGKIQNDHSHHRRRCPHQTLGVPVTHQVTGKDKETGNNDDGNHRVQKP